MTALRLPNDVVGALAPVVASVRARLRRVRKEQNMRRRLPFLILSAICTGTPVLLWAAPGDLDPGFGSAGKVTTPVGVYLVQAPPAGPAAEAETANRPIASAGVSPASPPISSLGTGGVKW